MAAGAIPADGETVAAHKPALETVDAPTRVERKQRILDAIDQMVVLNERGTFNANGAPKQMQLEKAAGFVVDTREIETLWHEYDAARKQDTIVDIDAVATIKDPAPIVTEEDVIESTEESEGLTEGGGDEQDTVEEKTEAKEGLGGQATEGQKAPDESGQNTTAVATTRSDMMDALKRANIKFPGNISNAKLKELYDASPENSAG